MRIGVLCDGSNLRVWQHRALDALKGHELFLLASRDTPRKRRIRHGAYYALNLFTVRNRLTRNIPIDIGWEGRHDFEPAVDGAWSRLPRSTLDWISANRLEAIVKFNLGLMHVPEGIPVLSYHHGDPREYRGRPAGFYELLHGKRHMRQIVQILCDRLDSGEVLACAESAIVPHSYKKTLEAAYSLSPFLLPEALEALAAGERVLMPPTGRNYTLPTNLTVARFLLQRASMGLRRLRHGALIERRGNVSRAKHGTLSECEGGKPDRPTEI